MSDNSSPVAFSDSIQSNLEILRELLRGLPGDTRFQAKAAAATVEKAILSIQRDCQNNPGAALGTAFAIYMFAQRLVQTSNDQGGEATNLIQLLH